MTVGLNATEVPAASLVLSPTSTSASLRGSEQFITGLIVLIIPDGFHLFQRTHGVWWEVVAFLPISLHFIIHLIKSVSFLSWASDVPSRSKQNIFFFSKGFDVAHEVGTSFTYQRVSVPSSGHGLRLYP